jgi:hypothetical protein
MILTSVRIGAVNSHTSSKSVNECMSPISSFIVLLRENSACDAVEHLWFL